MSYETLKNDLKRIWKKDQLIKKTNAVTRARAGAGNLWAAPGDIVPKKELMYLSVGIPDSRSLPRKELNQAMLAVLNKEEDTSLRYGFGQGYFPVRDYLADTYSRERGLDVTPDWFQLTNGSTAAIDLIVRSFIEPGDVIVTETPTYMGSLSNFMGVGAEICPVAVDENGLIIEELEEKINALDKEGKKVKIVYTISAFHNPTGVTLSLERKKALLALAAEHEFLILDDDAYGALYYDELPSMALSGLSGGYGVFTVGTFSKTLATGLRIGWIHAHPDAISVFSRMKFDMGQNQMALHMMGRFLESGHFEPHVKKMRALYKKKMEIVADAMDEQLSEFMTFNRPTGGFYLWVKLKDGLTSQAVWRTATHEGIAVNPGPSFMPDYAPGSSEFLRIAFCWTPMEQLEEAVKRLAVACQRVASGDVA